MKPRRGLVLTGLFAFLLGCPLHAEDKLKAPLTPPREETPLAEPEVAPRGRHAPRDITYSQWQKLCFKVPGKETLCRTSITGTWDTGQIAIRLDVIERLGSARLQILLPVGLYLQAGVKLKVDANERAVTLPYNWCFANLCVAAAPARGELIRAMEKGPVVSVEVVDTNLLNLTATIPLAEFASAYKGAPAKTIEQIVDE
jgi:invasion protein IalB